MTLALQSENFIDGLGLEQPSPAPNPEPALGSASLFTPPDIVREKETSTDPVKSVKAQIHPFPYAMEIRRLVEQERIGAARSLLKHALSQGAPTPDLLRWQEILGPARVRKSPVLDRDRSPEFRWLGERGEAYSGQWVAILGKELLASAGTLKELLAQLEVIQPPFPPLAIRLD